MVLWCLLWLRSFFRLTGLRFYARLWRHISPCAFSPLTSIEESIVLEFHPRFSPPSSSSPDSSWVLFYFCGVGVLVSIIFYWFRMSNPEEVKPCTLVLGHSFVRRLKAFANKNRSSWNLNLDTCRVFRLISLCSLIWQNSTYHNRTS